MSRATTFATEAQLQQAIINLLQAYGWYVVVTDAGEASRAARQRHRRGRVRPGTPDLVAFKNGRGLMIEVKTKRGRLSRIQEVEIEYIRSHGVPVLVARDLESVEDFIRTVEAS